METDLHWSFLFFGAGIDAMKDGGNLNVSVDNTLSYDNTILGTQSAYFTMNSVATRARGMSNTEYLSSKKSLLSDTLNENNT